MTREQIDKVKEYVFEIKDAKFNFNKRTEIHLKEDLYRYLIYVFKEQEILEHNRRFA